MASEIRMYDSDDALFFFKQALTLLGPTSTAQARALGLSPRSVRRYHANELPQLLRLLLDHPILLAALLLDALIRHGRQQRSHIPDRPVCLAVLLLDTLLQRWKQHTP